MGIVKLGRGAIALLMIASVLLGACSLPTSTEEEPEVTTFDGPPVVRIISPVPNATYLQGTSVVILARIENAGPDMGAIALTVNGINIGTTDASAQTAAAFSVESGWPATLAGAYTLEIIATREDGTASEPVSVMFNVQGDIEPVATQTSASTGATVAPQPTQNTNSQTAATATNVPAQPPTTVPAAPTSVPASSTPAPTNTPSFPTATTLQGANIRSGPATAFDPPLGSVAAEQTYRIVARNPDNSWFKLEVFNSSGWIAAFLVDVQGDVASLPVENPPPPPTALPTNTPAPTAVPAQVDLSIVDWSTNPGQPTCNSASTTTITVANSGSAASVQTTVVLQDLFNGEQQVSSSATIPALQPGQNTTVQIQLTVSTFFAQGHVMRVTVDPDNGVAETNESNNSREFTYVLSQGSC